MNQDGPALAQWYHDWLLTQHTPRYRGISSPAHRAWFKRVVTLAVVRFLTWHKYERSARGERDAIADPWVANQLHQLHLLREATKDLPRLVHHILDDPEHEQQLIEQFCSVLDERVKEYMLTPLDTLAFEADDWTCLSQTKDLAQRFLAACTALTETRIIESTTEHTEKRTRQRRESPSMPAKERPPMAQQQQRLHGFDSLMES